MGYERCARYAEIAKRENFNIHDAYLRCRGEFGYWIFVTARLHMRVGSNERAILRRTVMTIVFTELREHLIDDISILIMVYLDDA